MRALGMYRGKPVLLFWLSLCLAFAFSPWLAWAADPLPDPAQEPVPRQTPAPADDQAALTPEQVEIIKSAIRRASEAKLELNPEEEYYVGRAVAAQILASYKPYDCPPLNAYLNKLGQGLALFSSRPELYNGYRFIVLDSEEVNAFASPGGHILVTRGLLKLTRSEDELAAVLAHEITHVALRHGLASVEGLRLTDIISEAVISAGLASGGKVADFTTAFGNAIAGIAKQIIVSGYSQAYEFEADGEARRIIAAAGYDPQALARLISRLPERDSEHTSGFAATHPERQTRIDILARSEVPDQRIRRKPRIFLREDPGYVFGVAGTQQEIEEIRLDKWVPVTVLRDERFSAARVLF
ncbi:MAG: M48 family metalloprotease [Spirochaetaceae bacterium]|nr:M48 family metalloprotease [Spirochaetaceae bacterium]